MKKLLVSILLCSALFALPVMAADIDLGSMTLEELQELDALVEAEILAKGGGEVIGAGLYEAGKDIKAGDFELKSGNGKSSTVILFPSKESADSDSRYLAYEFLSDGKGLTIGMQDGYVLYLDGSLYIKQLEAPSWKLDPVSEEESETGSEIGAETETEDTE